MKIKEWFLLSGMSLVIMSSLVGVVVLILFSNPSNNINEEKNVMEGQIDGRTDENNLNQMEIDEEKAGSYEGVNKVPSGDFKNKNEEHTESKAMKESMSQDNVSEEHKVEDAMEEQQSSNVEIPIVPEVPDVPAIKKNGNSE
ncbi:hypothetical protein [Jeotgalibacillus proteolyticus]|uniref:hypothetical protein n=1 Tax=Jeotgalibacillus proteolyticus TaxID=2082395 RepID=UPI003CFB2C0F